MSRVKVFQILFQVFRKIIVEIHSKYFDTQIPLIKGMFIFEICNYMYVQMAIKEKSIAISTLFFLKITR